MTKPDVLYQIYLKSFSSEWVLWDPDEKIGHGVIEELSVALGKLDRENLSLQTFDEFIETLESYEGEE